MLALGAALVARGHEVWLQTWRRWREDAEAAGLRFAPAPEYQVFPTRERPLKPYEAAVRAARDTIPLVERTRPDAVIADILTVAPALAADVVGVPWATLVPHLLPLGADGFPPFSIGARLPRTPAGRAFWRRASRPVDRALELGRDEYNGARARLGLAPLPQLHTGLSRALTLVATLPQLEYPRPWPAWTRVVGPVLWEPPGPAVAPPEGAGPVVLIAPSTSQDPSHELVRATLAGLAGAPVRVIAVTGPRRPEPPIAVPANAVLVEWLSYARTMPRCDAVVMHGGHGTLVRALEAGCVPVICPAAGDMNESAARVDWAGLGVRLPRRLCGPRAMRLAVERALSDRAMRERTGAVRAWAAAHDGPGTAAGELERWLARGATSPG